MKAVGQWPWPRTVLADLVDKLAAGGAAAIGFDIVFPEPDRMSPANTLRFWPKSEAIQGLREEIEKLPSNDQVFAEAIGKAPVVLGFIAAPQGTSIPETKAGFAHGGDDPKLFAPYYPGAAASLKELQDQGPRIRIAELDSRARSDHPPHAHGDQGRRYALSLLRRRHAEARPRRLDLCREVVRRERREGLRREDRHRQTSRLAISRCRPRRTARCGSGSPPKPRSATCRPGKCSTARSGPTTSRAAS